MRTAVAALVLALSPLYVSAGFSDRKAPTTEFWKPTVGKSKDLDFGAIRELDIGWVATSATATTAVDCLTYGSAWVFNKTSGVVTSYPDMTTSQQDAVRGLRADAGCGDTLIVSDFGGQGKLLEVYRKGATYCPGGIMYPIFPALNMWNPWARAFFFALGASFARACPHTGLTRLPSRPRAPPLCLFLPRLCDRNRDRDTCLPRCRLRPRHCRRSSSSSSASSSTCRHDRDDNASSEQTARTSPLPSCTSSHRSLPRFSFARNSSHLPLYWRRRRERQIHGRDRGHHLLNGRGEGQ